MALSTAGDLIAYAFRASGINGVGQTPTADDSNDGLVTLAAMVAQWQRKRWLVWDLAETVLVSTGAASYTVGPAGNFAVARPDRIEAAFVRFLNASAPQLDLPLGIIESREDYNSIALKTLSTVPMGVFYDAAWPVGVLHFYPVPPSATYELHIFTKTALPALITLATTISGFPPEYIEALKYGLMVRLTVDWGLSPKPAHVQAMRAALNTIRLANAQIAELHMPAGVSGSRGSGASALSNPAFLTGRW